MILLNNRTFSSVPKAYTNIVYDKDWTSLIVHIPSFKDTEFIIKWFYNIQNGIISDKNAIESDLNKIRSLLIKYEFESYLIEVENELNT